MRVWAILFTVLLMLVEASAQARVIRPGFRGSAPIQSIGPGFRGSVPIQSIPPVVRPLPMNVSPVAPRVGGPVGVRSGFSSFVPGVRPGFGGFRPGFVQAGHPRFRPGFGFGAGSIAISQINPYPFGLYPYAFNTVSPYPIQSLYPYYSSPFYTAPPYVETSPAPASDQVISDLNYQIQQLIDEVERLQDQLTVPVPAPPPPDVRVPRTPPTPTILVFRDGRRLETQGYGIVGTSLWAFSENGPQKFSISDLDIDRTRSENLKNGITFRVP